MSDTPQDWTAYRIGQRVYCRFSSGKGQTLTVKSIGRKYVRFEELPEDYVSGFPGLWHLFRKGERVGQLFESEAAYQALCAAKALKVEDIKLPRQAVEELREMIEGVKG